MCAAIPIVKKFMSTSSSSSLDDNCAVDEMKRVQYAGVIGGEVGRDGSKDEVESIEYELCSYMDKISR